MSLIYANILLLVLVLLELVIILFLKKEKVKWEEVIFNLNSGHILMWILRGVEISIIYYITQNLNLQLLDSWSYIAQWIFCFVAWDFCFYWLHRFHHKYNFLWAVHVVHHEGEHFGLSLGIRNSWYSSLTSFPFFVGLAVVGVPIEIFIATSSIHYVIQFYNHNNLVERSGWLDYVLITPTHHKVHHGSNPEYIDKNFGGTFVFWDKLFGTFQKQLKSVPINYGVKGYKTNYDVVTANNLPFFNLLKIRFATKKSSSIYLNQFLVIIGGILVYCLLLYYIYIENDWVGYKKGILFILVFMATIANGGMLNQKRWGLILWCLIFLTLFPIYLIYFQIIELKIILLLSLLVIHSFLILIGSKIPKKDIQYQN